MRQNIKSKHIDILEICHGRIIPAYSSAYALRVRRYLKRFQFKKIISVGGLIFRDRKEQDSVQFRSLWMTLIAFLKGDRSLEILLSKGQLLRKKYLIEAEKIMKEATVVIFEGPWQYNLFKNSLNQKVVVYDAHNLEAYLRKNNKWENYTFKLENDLSKRADLIITVSKNDADLFEHVYNINREKITYIPEGFDVPRKKWYGINTNDIVFIGSAYLPNIEAAREILSMAEKLPEFTFKIIGSVCSSLRKRGIPKNVKLLGVIDEIKKEEEMCNSFLALNPVTSGSGRNLKMNDYISHGIPVITTEVGTRGFEFELREHFIISSLENFPEEINNMRKSPNLLGDISSYFLEYSNNNTYDITEKKAYEAITSVIHKRHFED